MWWVNKNNLNISCPGGGHPLATVKCEGRKLFLVNAIGKGGLNFQWFLQQHLKTVLPDMLTVLHVWKVCTIDWLMIAYIALFSALLSRLTALAGGSTWVTSFIVRFLLLLNIHQSGALTALLWLVPHETAAVSAQVLCTPYNHAPCHFMQSHICVFSCNLPPTLLTEWPGSFTCYCGNTGVERIPI